MTRVDLRSRTPTMDNISKVFCNRRVDASADNYEECEVQYSWEAEKGTCLVEKEMGIHRRKRRSIHGREYLGKIPFTPFSNLPPTTIYASCLEISEENVIHTIMDGCTTVEEMIKKLREQTISLTKKRCIKAQLTPVEQSKVLKLSFVKKLKYRMSMSFAKLKIGFRNFLYTFELWYSSLKVIEGKFGSSVATYFKFLRKLFILNCIIFLLNFFFVILPQFVSNVQFEESGTGRGGREANDSREIRQIHVGNFVDDSNEETGFFFFRSYPADAQNNNFRLGNLFTGMGYLSNSVLFYGHYANASFSLGNGYAYDIPGAYFFSISICYFLVLCVLFFSVAESYKKCYIETSNGVHNVFAEKIFCGWDFGIAKPDAEELKYCSIFMELKELLNESDGENRSKNFLDSFYTIVIRLSLSLILLLLLIALGWYTSTYLNAHMDNADIPTIMMLMLTLTLVATLAPVCFTWLAKIEFYDCPRTALYATLIRTFVVHVLIIVIVVAHRLNSSSRIACWETVVGQDIYRLVVLDLIVAVGDIMIEFIRSRMNKIWKRIERPEFNIARSTMNLIYNQALLYVGLYFGPGLSLMVAFKMLLTFYIKKWGAMYNCQPSKKPWRAAQMQTVFLSFAFLVFFCVIIAYGYMFTSVKTSNCGPFGGGKFVFEAVFYEMLYDGVHSTVLWLLSHVFRSGVIVIVLLLMMLAIYYLRSVNLVRRHIVENLRGIIKEQVAHKKKLLTRIHKAEEDFKEALKNINEDRKKWEPRKKYSSSSPSEYEDNADDSVENTLIRRKRRKRRALRSSNSSSNNNNNNNDDDGKKNLESRERLSKSSFNLSRSSSVDVVGSDRKSASLSMSLENLRIDNCDSVPNISSDRIDPFEKSRKVVHSHSNLREEEEEEEAGAEAGEAEDWRSYANVCRGNEGNAGEAHELTAMSAGEDDSGPSKRLYNCDERVPSRIYFARSGKGKR